MIFGSSLSTPNWHLPFASILLVFPFSFILFHFLAFVFLPFVSSILAVGEHNEEKLSEIRIIKLNEIIHFYFLLLIRKF